MIGRTLGNYRVLEKIGEGGMGEVYRAHDTTLDRDVAIKVLPDELSHDEERLNRFKREAKLLAQLNHANIATIHGLESFAGLHVLIMELVEGKTLAGRIAEKRLSIDDAVRIFIQIAEGLEAAHEKGIIHRDLKPANIKIDPDGRVKILDFGLAKALTDEKVSASRMSESPTITRGTAANVILGTAAYMSPEQARGDGVDQRSDLWSFGCVLYEALTGTTPFLRRTVSDTMAAILTAEPELTALPSALRRLVRRCLQKDPHDRLQHAGDARIELQEATTSDAPSDERAPTSSRLVVGLSCISAILLAVAAWSLMRSPRRAPRVVTRSLIPVFADHRVGLHMNRSNAVAITPDGTKIAYAAEPEGQREVYIHQLDQLEPTRIEEASTMPFFSPDSQWVGFRARDGRLMKASVRGGPAVALDVRAMDRGISWTESNQLIFVRGFVGGLSTVPESGGETELLTEPDQASGTMTHRFPAALPGGKMVLYTSGTTDMESWDQASTALLDLETGEQRVLIDNAMNARYSPSGHIVYGRSGSLFAVPFDARTMSVAGAPVRVVEGVAMSHVTGAVNYDLSDNGTLVYVPGQIGGTEHRIAWIDRQGRMETLVDTRRTFENAMISPDGRYLAVGIMGAFDSVWLYDMARGTLSKLSTEGNNLRPRWGPSGDAIAFVSSRDGAYNLFVQPTDGIGTAIALDPRETNQHSASWTPDGRSVLFTQLGDLWIASVEPPHDARILLGEEPKEAEPVLSPDGRWLAYTSDESGGNEVYLRRYPELDRKVQVSVSGGNEPLWNPNGRELFYRNGSRLLAVSIDWNRGSPELARPKLLFERDSSLAAGNRVQGYWLYDVTSDGQRFVTVDDSVAPPPPTHFVLVQNWDEELKRLVPTDR